MIACVCSNKLCAVSIAAMRRRSTSESWGNLGRAPIKVMGHINDSEQRVFAEDSGLARVTSMFGRKPTPRVKRARSIVEGLGQKAIDAEPKSPKEKAMPELSPQIIEEAIAATNNLEDAGAILGVHFTTLYQRAKSDPEISMAMKRGRALRQQRKERAERAITPSARKPKEKSAEVVVRNKKPAAVVEAEPVRENGVFLNDHLTPDIRERARRLSGNLRESRLTKEEIIDLIAAEYSYWHDTPMDITASVFAIGPIANIIGRIALSVK